MAENESPEVPKKSGTRSLDDANQSAETPANFLVRVVVGPDSGKSFHTTAGRVIVGSEDRCDLVLSDPFVSRQHLRMVQEAGQVLVEDLGSKNGSFYLRAKFQRIVVPYGSVVVAGQSSLRLLPVAPEHVERFGTLIGRSPASRQLFAAIEQVARVDSPVLIEGQSGTGKDEVAKTIHQLSTRSHGPVVFFDCASTPATLIHSALFGHVRGAFTGATDARIGVFEAAHKGTLVLNGIDEVPIDLQALLLRATETRSFVPLGETRPRSSDLRLLCTVASAPDELVKRGRLREDLFFRISALRIRVPSLSERAEDIPSIATAIAGELGVSLGPEQLAVLVGTPWPGNVRELRNAIERLGVLGSARTSPKAPDYASTRDAALAGFEAAYLRNLLEQCDGNVSHAARVAGLARSFFYRLLKRHGLNRRDDR